MPINYENGKIYKTVSNYTEDIYIGSTCQTLTKRKQKHKGHYKEWKSGKTHKKTTSFDVIDKGDFDIILLEDYPCERKDQLHSRERYWIENNDCVNKYIPTRTRQEYEQDNKEKIQKQKRIVEINNAHGGR